jgi:hypothetical protein
LVQLLGLASAAGASQVDDDVALDREEPGPDGTQCGIEAMVGPERSNEGLLNRLLCQTRVAK